MEAIKRVKEWRVGVSIPLPIVCETIALPFEFSYLLGSTNPCPIPLARASGEERFEV